MNRKLFFILKAIAVITMGTSIEVTQAQQVTTVAGVPGMSGSNDGAGSVSRFNEPVSVATDKQGNIYVADKFNNKIRKVTPGGTTTTFAGSGVVGSTDGASAVATFNEPWGIACDTLGNIYVADTRNYKIRRIDMNGMVTTVAGVGLFGTTNGPVSTARFGFPVSLAVSPDGSVIYVSEYQTHVIRKIQNGQVSTIAGTVYMPGSNDGSTFAASFTNPHGLAILSNGDVLIADEGNSKIRRLTPSGIVTTVSGTGVPGSNNGPSGSAQFNFPTDITLDYFGNAFIADAGNQTVRKLELASGVVSVYAGSPGVAGHQDGVGGAALFQAPSGIAFNKVDRTLLVVERLNHTLRRISPLSSLVVSLSVNGSATACHGQGISMQITPSGLSQFTVSINGNPQPGSVGQTFTLNALPSGIHTIQVTAMDANGAMAASNTVQVTVLPAFVPLITGVNGQAFCPGDTLILVATTGVSYQWSNGATGPQIGVTQPGSYTVTVANADGCTGTSAPFNATAHPVPVVQINAAADSVCPGTVTTLTASSANAWAWSEGSSTQSVQVPAGTYQVTITTTDGCSAVSQPFVVYEYEINSPMIQPTGPVYFFQGDSVALYATGLSQYQWSTGANSSSVWITSPGIITVTGTTYAGCSAGADSVEVLSIGASDLIQAMSSLYFCDGDSVVLSTMFFNNVQWYFEGQAISGETGPTYSAFQSGWYHVAVNYQGTLYSSDSLLVTVHPRPDVPVGIDTVFCAGSDFTLMAQSITGVNYHWYETEIGGTPIQSGLVFAGAGQNDPLNLYLEAENGWGCISSGRGIVDILFEESPVATFTHSVIESGTGYTITLIAVGNSNDIFNWLLVDPQGQLQTFSGIQVFSTTNQTGYHQIVLTSSTTAGCSDSVHKTILIGTMPAPFIPTTFTPNGDGKNDVFRIRGEQLIVEEMRIYDQWGTLVFQNNGTNAAWDGMSEGRPAPNATYLYQIRISDPLNTSRQLTGPVTLIR